jgi:DNA-binding XRE family transcriptional regulator
MEKALLYRLVGGKIREARERTVPRISQRKLADALKVSRATIVNVEAGRQHAPLHLLWDIATELGTEISAILPTKEELGLVDSPLRLDREAIELIENAANGDPTTRLLLTRFVSRVRMNSNADHENA